MSVVLIGLGVIYGKNRFYFISQNKYKKMLSLFVRLRTVQSTYLGNFFSLEYKIAFFFIKNVIFGIGIFIGNFGETH